MCHGFHQFPNEKEILFVRTETRLPVILSQIKQDSNKQWIKSIKGISKDLVNLD